MNESPGRAGAAGTVLRTSDAGKHPSASWRVPEASSLDFRDVEAIDADTAFVLSIGPGAMSRIYKTGDAGASWVLLHTNPEPTGFLDALAFWNADHGLALGDPVNGRFMILRTDDAGKTWAPIPAAGMPPALMSEGAFAASGTCLVVQGAGNAWFATGGAGVSRVFRSTDRGKTWSAHETPVRAAGASSGIFSLAFSDADHGVAVGGDYKETALAEHVIALTSDSGRTWRAQRGLALGGYRSAVACLPGTGGRSLVAVGPTGSDLSIDGGETWRSTRDIGFLCRRGFAKRQPLAGASARRAAWRDSTAIHVHDRGDRSRGVGQRRPSPGAPPPACQKLSIRRPPAVVK